MIREQICYIVVYMAEALTAIWYMDNLFAQRRKVTQIVFSTALGYLLLYFISRIEITALNTISFFLINLAILCYGYFCAKKTAILIKFLSIILTMRHNNTMAST